MYIIIDSNGIEINVFKQRKLSTSSTIISQSLITNFYHQSLSLNDMSLFEILLLRLIRKAISGRVLEIRFWQAKNSEALQENIIKVAKDDQDGVTATFDVWGAYDISAERSKTDVIRHIENLISETDKERINIKAFISDSAEEYAAARKGCVGQLFILIGRKFDKLGTGAGRSSRSSKSSALEALET
ncbi:unnamed protein product [Rhizophagus irregularis]|nr:unnamed protein product [Rhizophagus irregularis]